MATAKPLKLEGNKTKQMSSTDVIPIANIATGTPDGTKFVRDDGTLVTPTIPTAVKVYMCTHFS